MEKLFYFFDMEFEQIDHKLNLPFRIFIESIGYVGTHWHPDLELILCLRGCVGIGNSREQRILESGDLFLVNSDEVHSLAENEDNLILVLQIDPSVFSMSGESEHQIYFILQDKLTDKKILSEIRRDMAKMIIEKWDQNEGWETISLAHLYHLAGLFIRHCPSEKIKRTQPQLYLQQKRVKIIMDHLQSHYREKIKLNDLAEKLDISPFYLSHLIKENTGFSFQENLNFIRAGKAVNLLMKTNMKLLEISLSVGFSDPKYFNQYFKRLFGLTPRQLQRQPDWENAILNHLSNNGLEPGTGRKLIENYIY